MWQSAESLLQPAMYEALTAMISSVSVIVPAYNEAGIIEVTLREALAYFRDQAVRL